MPYAEGASEVRRTPARYGGDTPIRCARPAASERAPVLQFRASRSPQPSAVLFALHPSVASSLRYRTGSRRRSAGWLVERAANRDGRAGRLVALTEIASRERNDTPMDATGPTQPSSAEPPMRHCPRCERVLIGSARTCLVHGDQVDIGGRAPALETVADQLRRGDRRRRP